jgi:muconolactone delta-isomerase
VGRRSVVEFLVEFEVKVPTGVSEPEVEQREEAEASAAAKLFDQGHLERLWRMSDAPSGKRILGLYCAASGSELNDLLTALPMYEWMDVAVTPLEPHPSDPQDTDLGARTGDHACRMGRGDGEEYLVSMTTNVPEGTTPEAVDAIRAREAVRSGELAAQGHLLRLWRPPLEPGEWRTLGLFAADDDGQLEQVLVSMPLRVWRTDTVTALSPHPNDPARTGV